MLRCFSLFTLFISTSAFFDLPLSAQTNLDTAGACALSVGRVHSHYRGLLDQAWNWRPHLYNDEIYSKVPTSERLARKQIMDARGEDLAALAKDFQRYIDAIPQGTTVDVSSDAYYRDINTYQRIAAGAQSRDNSSWAAGELKRLESLGYEGWKAAEIAKNDSLSSHRRDFNTWAAEVLQIPDGLDRMKFFVHKLTELGPKTTSFYSDAKDSDKAIYGFFAWGVREIVLAKNLSAAERVSRIHELNRAMNFDPGLRSFKTHMLSDTMLTEYALILRLTKPEEYFEAMNAFIEAQGVEERMFHISNFSWHQTHDSREREDVFRRDQASLTSALIQQAAVHYATHFAKSESDYYRQVWLRGGDFPRLSGWIHENLLKAQVSAWDEEALRIYMAPWLQDPQSPQGQDIRGHLKTLIESKKELLSHPTTNKLADEFPIFNALLEEIIAG